MFVSWLSFKTQQNDADVNAFIESVENKMKRQDCFELVQTMERLDGEPAKMWGESIVGSNSVSCLYIKKLDEIDREVLEALISQTLASVDRRTTDAGLIE